MSSRIMADARERVLAGWCQGAIARDSSGRSVLPSSSEARRWSLLGALLASRDRQRASDFLGAVSSLHSSIDESPLEVWNDRPGRTQREVVAALERALEVVVDGGEKGRSADSAAA